MADPKVLELQKLLQLAGQNTLKQTGEMTNDPNDPTRIALANINKQQGFGKGIGEAANTVETQNYLNQFKSKLNPQEQPQAEEMKQAITQPTQAPSYTPATDNSGLINSQYDSLVNALKAKIQQSINSKNQQIANTPQQYQPLKDTNDVNRANNLRAVLEGNANAGDRGGVGRQAALQVDTARDSNLNAINLDQENQINALRNDIANLTLEGNIQGAQLQAEKLQALIANNQYLDTQNYGRQQDQFNNGLSLANLLGTYNGQRTLQGQQFDQNVAQQNLDNQFRQSQFDYQKQQDTINMQFQREQAAIDNAYRNRSLSLEGARLALSQAQDKRDAEMATLDRQYKQLQIDKAKNEAPDKVNYADNPDFADEINYINSNPGEAEQEILANSQALIQKYGYNGYQELLKAARGVY